MDLFSRIPLTQNFSCLRQLLQKFKDKFFKICSRSDIYPFFLNEKGEKKFLIYWCEESASISAVEIESLSSIDMKGVEVLSRLPPLSYAKLLALEGDKNGLEDYFGKMTSKLSTRKL